MFFDLIDPISWQQSGPYYAAALVFGYLLGSIPFGLLLTKVSGLGDIRSIGSGNIGATNVLRTGNRWLALGTLLLDGGKGAVAVLIARYYYGDAIAVFAGAGAILGHIFPIWLKFSGGKGVSTFLGLTIALFWPVGLLCCATWLAVAGALKYSSLSALIAAAAAPIYMALFDERLYAGFMVFLAILIFIAHRQNIARLIGGDEPKIGAGK
jgi:glycerol-3-phosphate acyltransferase PlsY